MDQTLPRTPRREVTEEQPGRPGRPAGKIKNDSGDAISRPAFRDALSPHGRGDKSQTAEAEETLGRLSPSPALSGRLSPLPHGPYQPAGGIYATAAAERQASPLERFCIANKPALLVALSQLFGATMNLSARFLELEGEGMHPVQMLLLRQGVTCLCCMAYMWWVSIPNYPFGKRDIRWLLLVRGCTGFFGIFGMWWSMMYLPLADATVITFLAPGVAGFVCYFLLREPFTRLEQLATLVALVGVVLIAQPAALFAKTTDAPSRSSSRGSSSGSSSSSGNNSTRRGSSIPGADHETTPQERLLAVGVALLGVLGTAGAFATLRAIGKRAHPLISVNAFAVICTVMCATALGLGPVLDIGQPSLRWIAPTSLKQWLLLLSLGGLGFVTQYLLTAGLAADKSNRANAMIYTHMLFAASFDRWIFGRRMGLISFAGCTLILGSAVGVIFIKRAPALPKAQDVERQTNLSGEAEGSPMLVGIAGHADALSLERIR